MAGEGIGRSGPSPRPSLRTGPDLLGPARSGVFTHPVVHIGLSPTTHCPLPLELVPTRGPHRPIAAKPARRHAGEAPAHPRTPRPCPPRKLGPFLTCQSERRRLDLPPASSDPHPGLAAEPTRRAGEARMRPLTHRPVAAKPTRRAGETRTRSSTPARNTAHPTGSPPGHPFLRAARSLLKRAGADRVKGGAQRNRRSRRDRRERPLLGPWKPDTGQEASGPTFSYQ